MSFAEAVRTGFQKYATFSGRARPSEYWWWVLFNFCVFFGLSLIGGLPSASDPGTFSPLLIIGWLGLIVPSLAVFVRRLHDTGRSGWYWFLGLIPLVGAIVLLVFLVSAGDPEPNQYGEPVPLTSKAPGTGTGA